MSCSLRQNIIVENRPCANTLIGAETVLRPRASGGCRNSTRRPEFLDDNDLRGPPLGASLTRLGDVRRFAAEVYALKTYGDLSRWRHLSAHFDRTVYARFGVRLPKLANR